MTTEERTSADKICLIVPVLNEEANIERLLDGIEAALPGQNYTVCILDDGSTDRTIKLVEAAQTAHPERIHLMRRKKEGRGSQRGSALLLSMLWGLRDEANTIFVEMDGDLSHRPEELPAGLTRLANNADVVIASKYVNGSEVVNRPWERRAVSLFCNAMVRVLLTPRIHDYSNGYRFYNRRAAQLIADSHIKYGSPIYLSEVMGIWLRGRLKIVEVPTTYVGRNEGVSKLRFSDLAKAGLALYEIAVRVHLTGFRAQDRGAAAAAMLPSAEASGALQSKS